MQPSTRREVGIGESLPMVFSELEVGDHFLWPIPGLLNTDSVNVNIKIARSDDGGGFATDLATRADCKNPFAGPSTTDPCEFWIPADTPVIKLNGRL